MGINVSSVDVIIIAAYILLVLAIGFYFRKRDKNSEEYFLAGRNVGWVAIGASLLLQIFQVSIFLDLPEPALSPGLQ